MLVFEPKEGRMYAKASQLADENGWYLLVGQAGSEANVFFFLFAKKFVFFLPSIQNVPPNSWV